MRARQGPGVAPGEATLSNETDAQSYAAGIARGAGVIAVITIFARIVGLLRTVVFSQTVGATCLGTAYVTANQVPNLVYEVVLGGALASVMVPVLARSAERSGSDPAERAQVSTVTSALLTWTLVILVPVTLVIVATAGPIATLLNPTNSSAACVHAEVVSTTATMLRIFAPQALLFGLSVVLLGVLQAYRRFAAYALAPLVNSLVVIASCLAFVPLGKGLALGRLPELALLVLSVGATLGVAAMVACALVPTWRLRLRFRPTLRLPAGIGRRAGGLALVGVAEIIATEIDAVVVIDLANGHGTTGALVLFNYASQVFNTLNAVLALSIVLSAFPVLAARDGPVFDRTCAGSTRAVVLASWLGVALIGSVSIPAARVLAGHGQVSQLALGLAFFAPGLVGLGVIGNLARALMAVGRLRIAAAAVAASALLAAVAQVVLVQLVPAHLVTPALALGYTAGQTGVAIPLVVIIRRLLGKPAVEGVGRAFLAGLAAAIGASVVGVGVSLGVPESHKLLAVLAGAVAATCAVIAFGVVAFRLDDGDLRVVVAAVRRAIGPRAARRVASYRDELIRLWHRPSRWRGLTQRAMGIVMTNWADQRHDGLARRDEPAAGRLSRRQRQAALALGVLAGGAGGYAVFATSNQAGTVVLLLISLLFLLMAVEGTPLLRLFARPGAQRAGGQYRDRATPRAEQRESRPAGLTDDIAQPEPGLGSQPAASSAGPDDGSGVFTADGETARQSAAVPRQRP
jgi:putative peptidoglycan lipid II flippase